jgi:hypothetical protein
MKVSGHLHAPAALPPGNSGRYPSDRRLLNVMEKRKIS